MTRTFNEKVCCPCGREHTLETAFERWVRNHRDLDSRGAGIVRFDLDLLLHKYKTVVDRKGSRDLQFMMFIEVKTYDAQPSAAQADTLHILDQVLRNQRPNMHSDPLAQIDGQLTEVWSKILQGTTKIRLYGGHTLIMDKTTPEDSKVMTWNGAKISKAILLQLLRFEVHPDRPSLVIDTRRRSGPQGNQRDLFSP